MSERRTILVTGATGKQGGSSARHLLAAGWQVRALVRDSAGPAAQELARAGVELVQGDLDDPDSVERAVGGVYGVHSVQAYMPKESEREVRQGTLLADVAEAVSVEHLVYSSAAGPEEGGGIPEVMSKRAIERRIRSSRLRWTVLRPTYFMENLEFSRPYILRGTFTMSLPPERTMQMVASDDIGAFVALAFADPDDWSGRIAELAGDELTMLAITATLSRVIGRPVEFVQLPLEQARAFDPNLALLTEWLNPFGFRADIAKLKIAYPQLTSFETWLERSGWAGAA